MSKRNSMLMVACVAATAMTAALALSTSRAGMSALHTIAAPITKPVVMPTPPGPRPPPK